MKEINKRIFTSIVLITIFLCSILVKEIFFISLVLILFQCFYEFYFILKKIFLKSKKNLLYLSIFLILIYLLVFIFCIANTFLFDTNNFIFLIMTITICVASDTGGYVFGKIFKGIKLTKISPKKTYSGLIGAYMLSILSSILFFNNYFTLNFIILISIFVSTVSQSGDLLISYLKRKAKIKNTGIFLPGHGGLLDRLDGIIFAIPFSLFLELYL